MRKNVFILIIIIVLIYLGIFFIDLFRVKSLKEPIFAIRHGHMGSMKRYDGLGYVIGLDYNSSTEITYGQMSVLGKIILKSSKEINYNINNKSTKYDDLKIVFNAKVIEVQENRLLVESLNDNDYFKKSEVISIGIDKYTDFVVGDSVIITFNGMINESYPPQISATKIEVINH